MVTICLGGGGGPHRGWQFYMPGGSECHTGGGGGGNGLFIQYLSVWSIIHGINII